jgi:transcriptional regulator with XRE-family HTH domain
VNAEQKPNAEEVAARLRSVMLQRGLTQRELARKANIGENAVGDALNGTRLSRRQTYVAICKALGINHMWALLGHGERDADEKAASVDDGAEASASQLLKPVSLGIDRWLTDTPEGRGTTQEEREYLRSVPFPKPRERHPDIVYHLTLVAYRQAMSGSDSSTASGSV